MGATKDLFMQLREEEVMTKNFLPTKKELVKSSTEFAKKLVDSGEVNIQETYAQALRLKESLIAIEKVLKNEMGEENFEAFGLTGTIRKGGATLNDADDPIWVELNKDLKNREELLKMAQNQDLIDSYGNEVPKVSKKQRASSLAISF